MHNKAGTICTWFLGSTLTRGGPVTSYGSWLTSSHIMACCLTVPSHYLNECWILIREARWHSSESNSTLSNQGTILYEFLIYIFKIMATPPRGQWVNSGYHSGSWLWGSDISIPVLISLLWWHCHNRLAWLVDSRSGFKEVYYDFLKIVVKIVFP